MLETKLAHKINSCNTTSMVFIAYQLKKEQNPPVIFSNDRRYRAKITFF